MKLGLFQSISPIIQYYLGKANIVADALSRSRRGPEEESEGPKTMDSLVSMAVSAVVAEEELKLWRKALQEDPNYRDTIQRLRSQQSCGGIQMTSQGLLVIQHGEQKRLVVPTSLRQQILRECHDVPSVGHMSIRRTLELLERSYHWKHMRTDATSYVRTCPTCQMVKSDHRKKAGQLQPIPPPDRKWSQVTIDLVTDLPEAKGYTAVVVFVDRLTKRVHFAPCTKEVTAPAYGEALRGYNVPPPWVA